MATRQQVLQLVEAGVSYEETGERLGIDAGLAFMIATGLPADASDNLNRYNAWRPGYPEASTQHLANPDEAQTPTTNPMVLDWIRQRASADQPMQAAAAARTADPGDVADPDGEREVTTVLTRDHDQVTALLEQLSAIPGHKKGGSQKHVERRESIVDMIAKRLAQHESVEQEYLWPKVREVLDDGDDWAQQGLEQEREGTETLTALRAAEPDTDEFDELVEKLVLQCRKHVAFEDRLFLQLKSAMDLEQRRALGKRIGRRKPLTPTRPHPQAPTDPEWEVKAVGLPTALADRVRDAMGSRPADREGQAEEET